MPLYIDVLVPTDWRHQRLLDLDEFADAIEARQFDPRTVAALHPYGVRTGQAWGTTGDCKGANRRGITRDDITKLLTERNRNWGPNAAA